MSVTFSIFVLILKQLSTPLSHQAPSPSHAQYITSVEMPRTLLHLRPPRLPQNLPDSLIMPSSPTLKPAAPEMAESLTMSTATHPMTLRKRNNRIAKQPPRKRKTKRYFRLMDLPTELRLNVYHHLLSAGKVSLLRASRLVYKEASIIVFSSAVFRTIVTSKARPYISPKMSVTPYTKPGQKTCVGWPPPSHLLQNISFRIDLYLIENGYYETSLQHLLKIIARMKRRRCCRIVLERTSVVTALSRDFVFDFLEQLRRFEYVMVTVTYDYRESDFASRAKEPPVPKVDSDTDYELVWARTRPLYDIVVCIYLSDACHSFLAG